MPYFPWAIWRAVDDVRCELKLRSCDCNVLADCGILNLIEFDVANDATILGAAAARQHSSSAAPMQLYLIIIMVVLFVCFVRFRAFIMVMPIKNLWL